MNEESFFKRRTLPPFPPDKDARDIPERIPSKIGPYSIETLLNRGGMSLLYLGTHPETRDPIAVKVLSPKFISHPEMTKSFLTEAEIIALADHPNIIKLFGYGEWEEGLYIAMEFIQGVSLRQYLMQNPLSLKRALELILEISYALCHLHTHGVIHRDLKPENILINEEGQVKVIDFGIAQLIDQRKTIDELQKKRLVGTPIYMSPEQRENPENVSYPSDIYSLGIIAYELVLGKLSHGKIHLSLMPKGLQKVLGKALQTEVKERYQDIVDFISDLSAYLHSSNLEKEKKASDQVGEFFEKMQELQFKIGCKDTPSWPFAEIGIVQHRSTAISPIYCEFLTFPNNTFAFLMAESTEGGPQGLLFISYLKGFLKGMHFEKFSLSEIAAAINDHFTTHQMDETFTFFGLILDPNFNLLSCISCGLGPLWIISEKDKIEKLSFKNIALGIEKDFAFESLSHSFQKGDMLVVCPLSSIEKVFTSEQFEHILQENRNFPPQKLVEAILRKAKSFSPKYLEEHPSTVLSIFRKEE